MLKQQEKLHNVFLRHAPVLVIAQTTKNKMAVIDSATALGYLDLAANTMGLGTCWAEFAYIIANAFPPVKTALSLTEALTTTGCMMLGYNKLKYRRITVRRGLRVVWR